MKAVAAQRDQREAHAREMDRCLVHPPSPLPPLGISLRGSYQRLSPELCVHGRLARLVQDANKAAEARESDRVAQVAAR